MKKIISLFLIIILGFNAVYACDPIFPSRETKEDKICWIDGKNVEEHLCFSSQNISRYGNYLITEEGVYFKNILVRGVKWDSITHISGDIFSDNQSLYYMGGKIPGSINAFKETYPGVYTDDFFEYNFTSETRDIECDLSSTTLHIALTSEIKGILDQFIEKNSNKIDQIGEVIKREKNEEALQIPIESNKFSNQEIQIQYILEYIQNKI